MTLLDSMMEQCVMLDKTSVRDGLGGFDYVWTEGAQFEATIIKISSPEVTLAEQGGVNEQYVVIIRSGVPLDYHDVFKRLRDGATFRVTGYARDSEAPAASTVQIAKVTAERWVIPA